MNFFYKKHSVTFSKIYINVLSFSCNLDKIHFLSPLRKEKEKVTKTDILEVIN